MKIKYFDLKNYVPISYGILSQYMSFIYKNTQVLLCMTLLLKSEKFQPSVIDKPYDFWHLSSLSFVL